ncbi:MAG: 16S rRNA (guanine(966)-N(2))-methyltransferase RsmD [Anaerolineales bacterium]|nr:16S rRNA (guanine(966)-N(2))-methyltransferase RsmD [Anaerolineales bacterium]MCW5855043.1 16S rRNA (guanine(966)-N(2))-methyltransferase RsmD [Anaerolineales bacterium]
MSAPRVIGGSARGRRLRPVPGDSTRPITDRAKEALFNILQPSLQGAALLDVFAGTGAVGIEALSRGAGFVRFLDNKRAAVETVRQNLQTTGLGQGAEIFLGDAFTHLAGKPGRAFDYVFIAPPQYHKLWQRALLAVDAQPDWLVDDGWTIVQIDPREYEALELQNLEEFDQRKYGNTLLVFYERKGPVIASEPTA